MRTSFVWNIEDVMPLRKITNPAYTEVRQNQNGANESDESDHNLQVSPLREMQQNIFKILNRLTQESLSALDDDAGRCSNIDSRLHGGKWGFGLPPLTVGSRIKARLSKTESGVSLPVSDVCLRPGSVDGCLHHLTRPH